MASKQTIEQRKAKESKKYSTMIRSCLTGAEAARSIGHVTLYDSFMKVYDYVNAQLNNNRMA